MCCFSACAPLRESERNDYSSSLLSLAVAQGLFQDLKRGRNRMVVNCKEERERETLSLLPFSNAHTLSLSILPFFFLKAHSAEYKY